MVKTAPLINGKMSKGGFKKVLNAETGDGGEINVMGKAIDMDDMPGPSFKSLSGEQSDTDIDDIEAVSTDIDHCVERCFVLEGDHEAVDRNVSMSGDAPTPRRVMNVMMINPLGVKRILSIWGSNADHFSAFLT